VFVKITLFLKALRSPSTGGLPLVGVAPPLMTLPLLNEAPVPFLIASAFFFGAAAAIVEDVEKAARGPCWTT